MIAHSKPIYLIDTNFLVHAYNDADSHKHTKALELLSLCWQGKCTYALSIQNLAEFFTVITKKVPAPLSKEQAEKIVQDMIQFHQWKILRYDEKTLQEAIELHKRTNHHFWDCLLVATMKENNITHIYTENGDDFKRHDNIDIENPFF